MIDDFWDMLKDGNLWNNLETAVSAGMAKMIEYLKSKNIDDINWVRIHYVTGFTIAFVGTLFIPLTGIVKAANVGKFGEILAKITGEIGITVSKSSKFVKIQTAEAYQKVSKALLELLELFKTDGQKLQTFVDDIWKKIADWFLRNKKAFEKDIKKVREYLSKSRRLRFKTTKMLNKYIGEETGNGWCAPSAVKYLDDVERLEYELAIVDGKLYTKNGKLFDTAFAGTERELTQKAIFVMDKEGRIYATNSYPRFQFHHSSFLSGAEVAAAGELKVVNGIVLLVSKQSGHYQPTKKYMLQFMKVLEENGIDVNKIIVEF